MLKLSKFCLTFALLVVSQTSTAHAQETDRLTAKQRRLQALVSEVTLPMVEPPMATEPKFLKSQTDRAIVMAGHTVQDLESRQTLMTVRGDGKFRVETTSCDLGASNYVMCAVTLVRSIKKQKKNKDGKKVTYTIHERKLTLQDSDGANIQLAQGKDISNGKGSYSISQHGIHIHSETGPQVFYSEHIPKVVKTDKGSRIKYTTKQYRWGNNKKQSFKVGHGSIAFRSSGSGRHNPKLQFAEAGQDLCMAYATSPGHGSIGFGCLNSGGWQAIAQEAIYDFRLVGAADGWMYLLYHSHASDSLEIVTAYKGKSWSPVKGITDSSGNSADRDDPTVDSKESGWQLEADTHGKTAYGVYYFFRNSYHKGIRVVELEGGALKSEPYSIVREKFFNTGWHPRFTITANGTVWLTYWDHILKEHRVWSRMGSPAELAKNALSEENMRWEKRHKSWFAQAGVGAWYTMWNLIDISPSSDDMAGLDVDSTEYSLSNTTLLVSSVEAELGGVNIGLSYAKSIVKDAQDAAEESLSTGNKLVDDSVGRLTGSIEVEKLFPGYDAKAQFVWGKYRGSAFAGNGVRNETDGSPCSGSDCPSITIDTNYIDAQALFLNKWRLKTGLAYTQYTLPMVLHAFYAPANQAEYVYGGSHFRDVQVKSFKLLFGYSSLDYVAKYENYFNDLFLDTTVDVGLALLNLDEEIEVGGDDVGFIPTLDARLNMTFGYLYFKRWYSLRGFGVYLRPAYVVEGSFLGLPYKPKDRDADDDDIDSEDSYISPGVLSVRHGPWLDFGIVF